MREIKIPQWLIEGNARQGKKVHCQIGWIIWLKAIVEFQYPEKWSQMSVKLFEVFLDIINLPCSSSSNFFMYPEKLGSGTFWFEWKCKFSIQRTTNAKHSQTCCIFSLLTCSHMLICRTWLDFDILNKLWSGPKRILMPLNTHNLINWLSCCNSGLNKHSWWILDLLSENWSLYEVLHIF